MCIRDSSNTVDNNVLSGNGGSGIFINTTADGLNTVTNNKIGTDPTGLLDQGNGSDGLSVFSPNNQIGSAGQGNLISGNTRWGVFTRFAGRGGNTIQGNMIGVDVTGAVAMPNSIGIHVQNENNLIGGHLADQENVISGNTSSGVLIYLTTATGNTVVGNLIGTDTTGTVDVGNGGDGVRIALGSSNVIGTGTTGYSNVISGNDQRGVLLVLSGTTDNYVNGNKIGTDITGDVALGNTSSGVHLTQGANLNWIEDNQISGNHFSGVSTGFSTTTSNNILDNLIGTDSAGTSPLHNLATIAVRVLSPGTAVEGNTISSPGTGIAAWSDAGTSSIKGNFIGTDAAETSTTLGMTTGVHLAGINGVAVEDNVIANNTTGLLISSGSQILVSENSFYDNASIGIDLGPAGATANDAGDADSGANSLQNSPVISAATLSGGTLLLTYQVDSSTASSAYSLLVEFYVSDGNGQGKTLLGTDMYASALASIDKAISLPVTGLTVGDKLVALVSDADGNTSEFGVEFTVS